MLLTHAVYGLITAVHQYVQLRVLATHGAMSVGLVNAVRASVVSVVSSVLFCNVKPRLCLTYWRGISALVVTVGAMQWVVAGEAESGLRKRHRIRLASMCSCPLTSTASMQQYLNDNSELLFSGSFCLLIGVQCLAVPCS